MYYEKILYSLQNLMHRKMRSWLTVLSILIGVMAVFALVSFGLGIKNYMDVLAQQAGTDKLFIYAKGAGAPGSDDNFVILKDELDFVAKINGVKQVTGMYAKTVSVSFKKQKKYVHQTSICKSDALTFLKSKKHLWLYNGVDPITIYKYYFLNGNNILYMSLDDRHSRNTFEDIFELVC